MDTTAKPHGLRQAQPEFNHLSQVYSRLGEEAHRHGMDGPQEGLIEELINRANGLALINPDGLDALLTEYLKRASAIGLADQVYDVGEICIHGAFALGKTDRSVCSSGTCAT